MNDKDNKDASHYRPFSKNSIVNDRSVKLHNWSADTDKHSFEWNHKATIEYLLNELKCQGYNTIDDDDKSDILNALENLKEVIRNSSAIYSVEVTVNICKVKEVLRFKSNSSIELSKLNRDFISEEPVPIDMDRELSKDIPGFDLVDEHQLIDLLYDETHWLLIGDNNE